MDFAEVDGNRWFMAVEAYSKWAEVELMEKTTAAKVIHKFGKWFARYGYPRQVFSDNGPKFCSKELKDFFQGKGIRFINSTPYHPKTNGTAERLIRTLKDRYEACKRGGGTPSPLESSVGLLKEKCSPAELFLGRKLPSTLAWLRPDVRASVEEAIWKRKMHHDASQEFEEGEELCVKEERAKDRRTFL